ncbi:DUF2382 domain-containing protein [Arthrobacter sp. ISL-72]|uniref:DUF2382 domain-containing protein n=1 Tax=Arthrobacter sp. ISL-72 TaxID=2819114 RepID=UPI001BEB3706|nr:PRC and DUF2382 domain-containing protein [Arthrobacter sp. ISL-72]MBT2594956.1 PRC and DUF2382 domain-containing protein [Arthrobacter sp. ISL-72]
MITNEHIDALLGGRGDVLGTDGEKIGGVGQVYADDDTGQPKWVTVKTGLFGTRESFVPLEGARMQGDDLVVAYSKDQIQDAPGVDPDGHLDPAEEDRLYRHYQLGGGQRTYTDATTGTRDETIGTRSDAMATDRDTAAGTMARDTSGGTADDAMTRSEERLRVGTEKQATGRARLRKYITTENVTQTVPVSREEVRIEREPITDANRDEALSGPDLTESEHEVTLQEERPVVEKETVPVERVRLDKESVTDEETVNEEVRKEQIDTERTDDTRR